MAPLPPIFNPRILYGIDPFPYTPLKMFGDYNRQIEQPADVFPTLSITTGLDPNNKGDVARFDANHNLKVVAAGGVSSNAIPSGVKVTYQGGTNSATPTYGLGGPDNAQAIYMIQYSIACHQLTNASPTYFPMRCNWGSSGGSLLETLIECAIGQCTTSGGYPLVAQGTIVFPGGWNVSDKGTGQTGTNLTWSGGPSPDWEISVWYT